MLFCENDLKKILDQLKYLNNFIEWQQFSVQICNQRFRIAHCNISCKRMKKTQNILQKLFENYPEIKYIKSLTILESGVHTTVFDVTLQNKYVSACINVIQDFKQYETTLSDSSF